MTRRGPFDARPHWRRAMAEPIPPGWRLAILLAAYLGGVHVVWRWML